MSDKAFPGNAALASLSLPSSFVLPASLVGSPFCAGGRCALVWIGDLAEIKTKRVKKRKNDRNDARLLRRLMLENKALSRKYFAGLARDCLGGASEEKTG